MKSKRVALFMPSPMQPHGGGAERTMMVIANALARRGYTVDFLIDRPNANCWHSLVPEVKIRVLGAGRYTCLPGLVKYIRRQRPDALLAGLKPAIITAIMAKELFAPRLNVVVRLDTPLCREIDEAVGTVRRKLGMAALARLLPYASAVIALNENMAAEVQAHAHGTRTVVIPNPAEIDRIVAASRLPINHPWFSDGRQTPVLVAASRLVKVKDLATLLKAFHLVTQQRPTHLFVMGDGPERECLIGLRDQLGLAQYVDFPGHVDNPFPYIQCADLFVLSSLYEGFGNVIVESMACGTTVVSTECPFGPSTILKNGELGYLAPPGDPCRLADAIIRGLDAPKETHVLQAEAQQYAADNITDAYESILGLRQTQ